MIRGVSRNGDKGFVRISTCIVPGSVRRYAKLYYMAVLQVWRVQ